jgi:hypothetical protein
LFDSVTTALISSAPELDGLDLDELPGSFTEAYVRVIVARMTLNFRPNTPERPQGAQKVLFRMKELAATQEALVAIAPSRSDRASAAFVAAAAHHTSLTAKVVSDGFTDQILSSRSAPLEVSATLLYLIAGSFADASEMAGRIDVNSGDNEVDKAFLAAVRDFAKGHLRRVSNMKDPDSSIFEVLSDGPTSALYLSLFRGIRMLATSVLTGESAELSQQEFRKVIDLSFYATELPGYGSIATSSFSAPYKLAALLESLTHDISEFALMNVSAPYSLDANRWNELLTRIAGRRPFLWKNHTEAIRSGYLERGTSAAVSFPTGAGKSTLSELKIAAAITLDERTIFLAPTLALVDQTARAIRSSFADASVSSETSESSLEQMLSEHSSVSVMTPERCLAILAYAPDSFDGVGLIVFDECHLLHPGVGDPSQRSVDAMLCVLKLNELLPMADFLLLSAMMKNAGEIASWLGDLTSRHSVSLDLQWKPTRQARAAVVFDREAIAAHRASLVEWRSSYSGNKPPARLGRTLLARPHGFFGLRQKWDSSLRNDYALYPLLDEKVLLSTGRFADGSWYLTPNGNTVAAALGTASASRGMKTLIFSQTIPFAVKTMNEVNKSLERASYTLSKDEQSLYDNAAEELGSVKHLYIDVDSQGVLRSSSLCHHSLLLPVERRLHESLYKAPGGIDVLVATSTLSQGMNLPSEIVIITGDSRFDPQAQAMQKLEAHEMLNAAGRAGRAGESANAVVLVVPSKVIDFDDENNKINTHWEQLQSVFGQSDQCIDIADPLAAVMNTLHSGLATSVTNYFLRRLPGGESELDPPGDGREIRVLMNRSLAAHRARSNSDDEWLASRVSAVVDAKRESRDGRIPNWVVSLAEATGVPVEIITHFRARLEDVPDSAADAMAWIDWTLECVRAAPRIFPSLVRPSNLKSFLGSTYEVLQDDGARGALILRKVEPLLRAWLAGKNLFEIDQVASVAGFTRSGDQLLNARKFVLKIVPDLSYLFGLPAIIVRTDPSLELLSIRSQAVLDLAGVLVHEGVDTELKLDLKNSGRTVSRQSAHRSANAANPD